MNGFVATPPAPNSPDGAMVEADGWFPAIDVNAMRDALRLRGEVPHARLVAAIEGGIVSTINDLSDWKAGWVAGGATNLEAVKPGDQINGKSRLGVLFTRAVRFYAGAELADLARDMSATREEAQRTEEESLIAQDMRRMAIEAVRDMLGVTRVAVELI